MKKRTVLSLVALSALYANAQQPDIGDALRQQQQLNIPQKPQKELPKFLKPQEVQVEKSNVQLDLNLSENSKKTIESPYVSDILVREFRFRGNESIRSSTLRKQVSMYEGKMHDTASLLAIAETITKYYKKRGFINAKAYLFKPDVGENGVVTFTIRASGHDTITQDLNLLSLSNPLSPLQLEASETTQKPESSQESETLKKESPEPKKLTTRVEKFIFEGVSLYKDEELLVLLKPYMNTELTFDELKSATSVITRKYRKDGYFVALAYIPAQTVENGIVKINVVEGKIGQFNLSNSSLVKDEVLQAVLDEAKNGESIHTDTIERAMLLINDLSGVYVTQADIRPGTQIGTSDFEIKTEAGAKYGGYAVADNYGSRYTGRERVSFGAGINSFLGFGDRLFLSSMVTNQFGIMNMGLNYTMPLTPSGLSSNLFASYTKYELGKELKSLESVGEAVAIGLGVEYPFIRSRLENLKGYTTLSYKDLKDEIKSNDSTIKKSLVALNVGTRYDKNKEYFGIATQSYVELSYTAGRLYFDSAQDKSNDKSGADTEGFYNKVNLTLKESLDFKNNIIIMGTLQAQYALGDKNLDGSEDMSLGGGYGVRVFPVAELNAENGYLFKFETKYNLPSIMQWSHNVFAFYDRGRVSMSDNEKVNFESRTLQDIGLGYNANYENFYTKFDFARVVGSSKVESEPEYSNRFLVQMGYSW